MKTLIIYREEVEFTAQNLNVLSLNLADVYDFEYFGLTLPGYNLRIKIKTEVFYSAVRVGYV